MWNIKMHAGNIAYIIIVSELSPAYMFSLIVFSKVNARISGLYLCIFYSLRLRCGVTMEPIGDGLGVDVTPILTQDYKYLQITAGTLS